MGIEIQPIDLLTKVQRKELGDAVFKRLMNSIETVDITDLVKGVIKSTCDEDEIYEQIDFEKIGNKITNKIIKAL